VYELINLGANLYFDQIADVRFKNRKQDQHSKVVKFSGNVLGLLFHLVGFEMTQDAVSLDPPHPFTLLSPG